MRGLDRCAQLKPIRETAAARQARHRARREARRSATHGRAVTDTRVVASRCPDLAFPKGATSDERTAEDARAEAKHIAKVRRKVFALTSRCELCGDNEYETALKSPIATHQLHEDPSRAKTRGLPLEQRFSIYICGRVCAECHDLATRNVIRPYFHDDVKRWRGDYDVIESASGQVLRHMRRSIEDLARQVVSSLEKWPS